MRYIALVFLIFLSSCSTSQTITNEFSSKAVTVKNWGEVAFFIPEGYWTEKKVAEIVKQIGYEEFERVKLYLRHDNIPCALLLFCNGVKKELDKFTAKLQSLKVFEIANYQNFSPSGELRDDNSILMVPYKGNEKFDITAKWDKVYFIIERKYLETSH